MTELSALGVVIDTDLEEFKEDMLKRPVGELLSLKNLLSLKYNEVKTAFNELTEQAVKLGKSKDPEYVTTLQGMNVQMFKLEQKVLFLNDRISDLMID